MGAPAWGLRPALRFPSYRVTGGGHPPPVPTEGGLQICRTTLRQLIYSTARACSSRWGRRAFGRPLVDLIESIPGRPAQLRLHSILRQ
jgi:hypothetical protein